MRIKKKKIRKKKNKLKRGVKKELVMIHNSSSLRNKLKQWPIWA